LRRTVAPSFTRANNPPRILSLFRSFSLQVNFPRMEEIATGKLAAGGDGKAAAG
jgi:hypothetical protein